VVEGVASWLEDHPEMDKTSFLITAVAEKLCSYKIRLIKGAVASRMLRKLPAGRAADSNVTEQGATKLGGRAEVLQMLEKKSVMRLPGVAANKLLLKARMDESLVGGIERWLNLHPRYDRTDFIHEAVTAKLARDGIKLPKDAVKKANLRWPISARAYSGSDDREAILVRILEYAEKMMDLQKQFALYESSKKFKSPVEKSGPNIRTLRTELQQLARIKRQLQKHVAEIDKFVTTKLVGNSAQSKVKHK
jgi:hypothetical protein